MSSFSGLLRRVPVFVWVLIVIAIALALGIELPGQEAFLRILGS